MKIRSTLFATLLFMTSTTAHAQDDSFDMNCGVRSADDAAKIVMLHNRATLTPATLQRIETGKGDEGTLRLPGLEITGLPQMITHIQLTADGWRTLDGLAVGMTMDDVLSIENLGGQPPSVSDRGELRYANGDPTDDPFRLCVTSVAFDANNTVSSISIVHAPMSIIWDPAPAEPPQDLQLDE